MSSKSIPEARCELALVAAVDAGDLAREVVVGLRREGVGVEQAVLGAADRRQSTLRGGNAFSDSPSASSARLTRSSWSSLSRMAKSRRSPTRSP